MQPTDDRRIYLKVDRSGGRPGFDQPTIRTLMADERAVVQIVEASAYGGIMTFGMVLNVLGRWLAYRLVFRGGWTVQVDAPDRDPVRIRCRNRDRALETALDLARRWGA